MASEMYRGRRCTRRPLYARWAGRIANAIVIAISFGGCAGAVAQTQTASEYEVKAAYVYNFTKFVEWPAEAFARPDDPIRICVLGDDPFGNDLATVLQGKTVAEHKLRLVQINDAHDSKTCHVLFIGNSERHRVPYTLREVSGCCVLTVAESKDFTRYGGMINLVVDHERVRFDVNLTSARRAHLKVSARLLGLARVVVDDGEP
jgi:hypothetical protein